MKLSSAIELDVQRHAVRYSAKFAKVELFLADHRPPEYRAEALRPESELSCFVRKRTPSSSVMTTGRQSRVMLRTSPDEEDVYVRVGGLARVENVINVAPEAFGALHLKVESDCQVLKVAMSEARFTKD